MNQSTTPPRIAVVRATWHDDLVERCHHGFLIEMGRLGIHADHVDTYTVPGAVEIPLHVRRLAQTGRYEAIVAMALVVDGGIFRHEFVASAVVAALVDVGLSTDVPVLSAVLTPLEFRADGPISDFFSEHLELKGLELAQACIATLASLHAITTA